MYARSSAVRGGKRGDGASSPITSDQAASPALRGQRRRRFRSMRRRRPRRNRQAIDHDQTRRRTAAAPCGVEGRHELGRDDRRLDAARREDARGACGRTRGVNRNVRRARAQDAVNRRHRFQALGQPEPDSIATIDAPASQPRGHAIRAMSELGIALPLAVLVFDGGMFGPPLARPRPAVGLSGVRPWLLTYPAPGSSGLCLKSRR